MANAVNKYMHPGQGKPVKNGESPAVSTGKGGIPASLKVKAAGTKDAPGVDKTVNKF
jgi:hypothetical protein